MVLNILCYLLMISYEPHGFIFKSKDEVFLEFVNCVENQFNAKIKIFTSDNGTEFVNNNFANLLKEKGIIYQTTCIDTP